MSETTGTFKVTIGGEDPYRDGDAVKLTRAYGSQEFSGGIEGTGHIEWLMCYRKDRTAAFVGMQEIEGTLDGRRGAFVLSSAGSHDGQRSEGRWEVVSGSGQGDLVGITGTGSFTAGPGPQATFKLSYDLE